MRTKKVMKSKRLTTKLGQLIVDSSLNAHTGDVFYVHSHSNGELTGNVNIKGKVFHSIFDISLGAWRYDPTKSIGSKPLRAMR